MNGPIARVRSVQAVAVPTFIYGTAWKEEETARLVREALEAGFRGIDTANQPRHYREEGVGRALAGAFGGEGSGPAPAGAGSGPAPGGEGSGPAPGGADVQREDLFIQTKFTHPGGQDHRIPYDPRAPVAEQVSQSFRSSLEHLGLERLDSYVLHGPSVPRGLGDADREAWRAMEAIHEAGGARLLGVSNVRPDQLEELYDFARVPVAFVQNRCFARLGWDRAVRAVCEANGIVYQAFSLLTANPDALRHPVVGEIARRHGRTIPQVIFRFALEVGMIPLTGTTDRRHMEEDLRIYEFELAPEEVRRIEGLAG